MDVKRRRRTRRRQTGGISASRLVQGLYPKTESETSENKDEANKKKSRFGEGLSYVADILSTADTKVMTAALKKFVNAADVDRILVKNQGFLAFIDFNQIRQMYKYEYNKEVRLHRVMGTFLFNGIYVYEKKYLDGYLEKFKNNVKLDTSDSAGDVPNEKPDSPTNTDLIKETDMLEQKENDDRAFIECATMPAWTKTQPLALLNDFRLVDPKHKVLEQNKNKDGKIRYISFYEDLEIFYRLLVNYKHQLTRAYWNASEFVLLKHIKFFLMTNYAFIKRNPQVSARFKIDSGPIIQGVKYSNDIMKAIMSICTTPYSAAKNAYTSMTQKKEEEGAEEEGEEEKGPQGAGGAEVEEGAGGAKGAENSQSGGGYIQRRIGVKLYKYYNYNFERYFTTATSSVAVKNIAKTLTFTNLAGLSSSEYLKPKFMDAEVVFAIIFAIDMLTRDGYGVNKLDEINAIDMTDLTRRTTDLTDPIKTINYNGTEYTFNFSVEGVPKVENEVDMRIAKEDSSYLLEGTKLYEDVINNVDGGFLNPNDNSDLGIDKWINKLYETYKDKSKTPPQENTGGKVFTAEMVNVPAKYISSKINQTIKTAKSTIASAAGKSEFYKFLNVVFDKCYRFMTQRVVWELERLYLYPDKRPKPTSPRPDSYINYSFEENLYYFMKCVNQTKIDSGNVLSSTLLYKLLSNIIPGPVTITPHLLVTIRLVSIYMGNLMDLLEPTERRNLASLFKPKYVEEYETAPHTVEDIANNFEKYKKEAGGKFVVGVPLNTGSVRGELIQVKQNKGKYRLMFTLVERDTNMFVAAATGRDSQVAKTEKTPAPCVKYKNLKGSVEIYFAKKINNIYENGIISPKDDSWTITVGGDSGSEKNTQPNVSPEKKEWNGKTYDFAKTPIYIGFNGVYKGVLEKITFDTMTNVQRMFGKKTQKGGNLRKKKTKRKIDTKMVGGDLKDYTLFHIKDANKKTRTITFETSKLGNKSEFIGKTGIENWFEIYDTEGGMKILTDAKDPGKPSTDEQNTVVSSTDAKVPGEPSTDESITGVTGTDKQSAVEPGPDEKEPDKQSTGAKDPVESSTVATETAKQSIGEQKTDKQSTSEQKAITTIPAEPSTEPTNPKKDNPACRIL